MEAWLDMKKRILLMVVALFFLSVFVTGVAWAAKPNPNPNPLQNNNNEKCGTAMSFTFDPAATVIEGAYVTMIEEITVTTEGSGTQDCDRDVGQYVNDGNAMIRAVTLGEGGPGRPCSDLGKSYCTKGISGEEGNACDDDADCITDPVGNGVCTAVTLTQVTHENPSDGSSEYGLDTTGLGGQVLGFQAKYEGGGNFENPNPKTICNDLTVNINQICAWSGETAWADGPRYVDQGNWATYTFYEEDSGFGVPLKAGQTMEAGTVQFSEPVNGEVTITIELNEGWRFKDVTENVKIQDYATAPAGNPSPGLFAWKGNATGSPFSITVSENNFYGVHVDVEECR
jgi:hypothetical protein